MTRGFIPRPSETEIRDAIEATVRERFADGEIALVRSTFDTDDMDGSDIITVRVVFAGKKLDPKKMLSIGGALRVVLQGMAETAFPMVSFVSLSDHKLGLKSEPR